MGWGVNGAVGFDFGNGPRAEAEVSYLAAGITRMPLFFGGPSSKDFKTIPRVAVLSFMANGLYAIDTGSPFRPFLGLGIGASHTTFSVGEPKEAPEGWDSKAVYSGWGPAYQARAGIAYEISDGFSILLGYRVYGSGYTLLSRVKTLEKDDPDYDVYDTAVEYLPIFGSFVPPLMTHRIELGVTYRLPF